jgi:hypothetical protein
MADGVRQIDSGLTSAGELIDHLDALSPSERRALLDQARKECGLEPSAEVDWRRHYEALQHMSRRQQTEVRRREDGTFYEVAPDA